MNIIKKYPLPIMSAVLTALVLVSFVVGRYHVTLGEILQTAVIEIMNRFFTLFNIGSVTELSDRQREILFLMGDIRLPRILAAVLVGAALASSGAVYQAMFVNPLVSPGILGVLAGASFGAALGIVIIRSWLATQILAFVFACVAVALSILLSLFFPRSSLLVLILGGMISSAFFTALSSLLKYIADPTNQLPALVYWLMGTFANVNNRDLIRVGPILLISIVILCARGKLLNALSLGDEEAMALGISVKRKRIELIALSTLASACTVAIAGTIGWIGLVVPHMVRFVVGPDNRRLLPLTAVSGACYMLFTDMLVRAAFTVEIPIGIVTSLVSLPIFVYALYQNKGRWS
ncbi:FecCD family ABC transporter permease [Treponema primitia]|uniref:FecCD family ABC transporter permease n=1 Tax=Treponema primitia TaxID=88058 RepID=UPI0002555011|nr:iron ABC transporter permease [Treponema primitia]